MRVGPESGGRRANPTPKTKLSRSPDQSCSTFAKRPVHSHVLLTRSSRPRPRPSLTPPALVLDLTAKPTLPLNFSVREPLIASRKL